MGTFYNMVNQGLEFCENYQDFPDVFTYSGSEYKGFHSQTTIKGPPLQDGGYMETLSDTLLVRKAIFTVVSPIDSICGEEILLYNRTYRVENVADDRLTYLFTLVDPNK